jgi:thiamine biosynthesis protein ThiS
VREDAVAVERNGALVRRRDWAAARLAAGDAVEVVTFVGGG